MKATPKYLIPELIGSLRTRSFMLLCLCAAFPMTTYGDPAVGVIQGDVFMSWRINSTNTSLLRVVINPANFTVIYFHPNNVTGNVPSQFRERVRDIGNVSLGIVSFLLLNLTVADAGRYWYIITSTTYAGGQDLVIAGNPANITVIEVTDPFENEKYTVQCSAQSTSVPPGMGLTMNYQWTRENGQIITADDRYSFSSDQSNLIINPLNRQDAGTLVCKAWEHVGAVSQKGSFSLKVIYGPDNGSITLSPNQTAYEAVESSPLSINCSADCYPDCQYNWTGPNGGNYGSIGMLSIPEIKRDQAGSFTCTATNPAINDISATANIYVAVLYGPDSGSVTLSPNMTSYEQAENSSLSVNCSAACYQNCQYRWYGPWIGVGNTGMLSIPQIRKYHTGVFTCTVTNPGIVSKSATATINLTVFYGPGTPLQHYPGRTSYRIVEGATITDISCGSNCYPSCEFSWTGPVSFSNRVLSLGNVTRSEGGNYTCSGKNTRTQAKTDSGVVTVIVIYGPDTPVLTPSSTKYILKESGILPNILCYTECFPGCKTYWYKEQAEVPGIPADMLSLGHVYRNDSGTYICQSQNIESNITREIAIQLVVQLPGTYESPESLVAGIAGGVSAGLVVILVIGIGLILWKRNQHKKQTTHDNDVTKEPEERHNAVSGQDNEGQHFTRAEASPNLQLNDIRLEENRNTNTRSPESDSSEKLHTYANDDIQMYSSLKIPNVSKDSEKRSPESDSYDKLHTYANDDIQMYGSLKFPNVSKDSERRYENTWME